MTIAVVCNCKRYSVWNFCTFSEYTCSCGIFFHKSSFSSTYTYSLCIQLC